MRSSQEYIVVRADRPTETFMMFTADFADEEVLAYVEKEAAERELTLLVYKGGRYVGASQAWGKEPAAGCIA
jgi:hypothetical protein